MPSAVAIDVAEPTDNSGKTPDAFQRLVQDINRILGPTSGLTSADVDPEKIKEVMRTYSSNEAEWKPYAMSDPSRTFTRNLVDRGNGKSNLLILVWTPGKTSPIHDHANSHCIMKILKGSLKETLYTWPDRNVVNNGKPSPLQIQKETVYTEEQVTYMSDDLGLHKLGNPDTENFAVSLHLYTPPNAAKVGCSIFNQQTGAASHMTSSYFFSEMGQKIHSNTFIAEDTSETLEALEYKYNSMNQRPAATAYVTSVSRRMIRRTQLFTILGLCVFIGFTLLLLNSAEIPSSPNHPPASESPSKQLEKPLTPSSERPSTRIEKPLSPSTGHLHPIHQLIAKAEEEQEELKKGQSQSLGEAVKEYRRRYKIPPPPHFDKWYEFAKEKGVEFIDEYDTIYHSLLPFWALQPRTIRGRAQEALGFDNALLGLLIRDGRVISAAGGNEWQQKSTTGMIKNFVKHLPDMDLPFNVHDEPRVTVPHDDLSRLVARAKDKTMPAAFKNQAPSNSWSARPADVDDGTRFHEFKTTRFNKFAHQPTWTNSRVSCSPESPSRGLEDSMEDDPTPFSFSELGFVSNKTAFSDICLSPSLRERFGFFNRPNAYDIVHDLFPVFSQSKISSYQDILYPSPWYWSEKVAYQEGQDYAWEKKQDQMYWRGSTTGGFSRDGGWRRQHRQLFVEQINALGAAKILEHQNSSQAAEWKVTEVRRPDYRDLFNVKFSHVGQCDPEDCHAQSEFFEVVKPAKQHEAWAYKYLLDIDGNAFSGRFYAFLKSKSLIYKVAMFREWHDEWLRPWVHYIPLSLRGDEYVESVRYFKDEETGRIQSSKIAQQGRDWAGRVLRNEDLEVWLFRLLLEYGRLVDDNRAGIGYSAP